MLKTKKLLTAAFAAMLGLILVGCPKPTDEPKKEEAKSGVDFTDCHLLPRQGKVSSPQLPCYLREHPWW